MKPNIHFVAGTFHGDDVEPGTFHHSKSASPLSVNSPPIDASSEEPSAPHEPQKQSETPPPVEYSRPFSEAYEADLGDGLRC
jgi:hypothetical protein